MIAGKRQMAYTWFTGRICCACKLVGRFMDDYGILGSDGVFVEDKICIVFTSLLNCTSLPTLSVACVHCSKFFLEASRGHATSSFLTKPFRESTILTLQRFAAHAISFFAFRDTGKVEVHGWVKTLSLPLYHHIWHLAQTANHDDDSSAWRRSFSRLSSRSSR